MGGSPRLKVPCTPGGARTEGPIHPLIRGRTGGPFSNFLIPPPGGPGGARSLPFLKFQTHERVTMVPPRAAGCRGGCRRSLSVAGGREMGG